MISGPLHHFQLSDFYNRSFDEKKTCQNERELTSLMSHYMVFYANLFLFQSQTLNT